jgi:hypothetical protein
MTPNVFAVCFLIGALAVALWIDIRFPALAPTGLRPVLWHVGGTIVGAQLLVPLAMHLLGGPPAVTLVAVFLVAFPALVYTLLAAIWIFRIAGTAFRGRLR